MNLFHKHKWIVLAKTYSERPATYFSLSSPFTVESTTDIAIGETHILLSCECGKIKTVSMPGKEVRSACSFDFKASRF